MIKSLAKAMLRNKGLKVVPQQARAENSQRDMSHPHPYIKDEFIALWKNWQKIMGCEDCTNSIYTTYNSLKYVITNNIEGDLVDSNVCTGAQYVMTALTMQALGDTSKRIYMYDTYSGTPEPSEKDYDHIKGMSAGDKFDKFSLTGLSHRHGPLS